MHAADHEHRRVAAGGKLRHAQRVAHVVGDVLDLAVLIVMGQDHSVALGA